MGLNGLDLLTWLVAYPEKEGEIIFRRKPTCTMIFLENAISFRILFLLLCLLLFLHVTKQLLRVHVMPVSYIAGRWDLPQILAELIVTGCLLVEIKGMKTSLQSATARL